MGSPEIRKVIISGKTAHPKDDRQHIRYHKHAHIWRDINTHIPCHVSAHIRLFATLSSRLPRSSKQRAYRRVQHSNLEKIPGATQCGFDMAQPHRHAGEANPAQCVIGGAQLPELGRGQWQGNYPHAQERAGPMAGIAYALRASRKNIST